MGFGFKSFFKSVTAAAIPATVAFFTGGPVAAVAVLGLSVASSLLAPKPKQPDFDFPAETRDRNQLIRSSVAPRRLIYGEMVSSGPIVFAASTGTNNKFLHLVIPLAGHECEAIKSVFVSDQEITEAMLDGSGNVTSGRYNGKSGSKSILARRTKVRIAISSARFRIGRQITDCAALHIFTSVLSSTRKYSRTDCQTLKPLSEARRFLIRGTVRRVGQETLR